MPTWNIRSLQILTCAIVLCFAITTAIACLWDRDTLRYEARGVRGVVEIITGRIERNPPLYYEMRLDRVTKELDKNPGRLDLYDDAGVACDFLKRGDEAIEWMNRKKVRLDALDTTSGSGKDHLYRYHANLGTFLSHRWLRAGANREGMDDIRAGREHIAEALKINPNAHFGREALQLKVMDWLIDPPEDPEDPRLGMYLRERDRALASEGDDRLARAEATMKGICSIIALGDAWENVDLFLALKFQAALHKDASIALLADLRVRELIEKGKNSVSADCRKYLEDYSLDGFLSGIPAGGIDHKADVEAFYTLARGKADAWRTSRDTYMLDHLNKGQHPDTHADFWKDYRESPPPTPPGSILPGFEPMALWLLVLLGSVALIVVIKTAKWCRRRFAKSPIPG